MKTYFLIAVLPYLCSIPPVVAQNYADCATAFPLCDKAFVHFAGSAGIGEVVDADFVPCFMNGENYGQAEENATWIYFQIKEAGQLTFIIFPDVEEDDMDFALFQLPENGDCDKKQIVRCMAAGSSEDVRHSACMGPTGLAEKENDTSEDAGCSDDGDNNWLQPLDTAAGEKYTLLISNVTNPNGFTIYLKGSALLEPCALITPRK